MRAIYQNLLFTWHNSHSKLIFGVSKSPQCKQGLQEKQARIHSLTQENHKSECFCMKWKKKKRHKSTASINFLASKKFILLVCIISLQHYLLRCQDWRLPKQPEVDRWVKLLWCSQNGCFHAMPERNTDVYMTLYNFSLPSRYASLNKTQFSSRSQRATEVKVPFMAPEQWRSGQWVPLWARRWYLFSFHTPCRAVNITLVRPV